MVLGAVAYARQGLTSSWAKLVPGLILEMGQDVKVDVGVIISTFASLFC